VAGSKLYTNMYNEVNVLNKFALAKSFELPDWSIDCHAAHVEQRPL
jgi:hypothetical protein